ncbi:LapA family protein [Alkalibacillus aidingensis]|uniref:LapA family protein n=1 Tax=Alkalibacillus aidingensis TaxID=2747607 RepID=UPI0016606CBC|nr:LapA family protein [Alkalibacillus aidingensis]
MDHTRYYVIPGGLILGLGIGLMVGNPGAGMLIGLGLGFLISPLFVLFEKKNNRKKQLENRLERLEKKIENDDHSSSA